MVNHPNRSKQQQPTHMPDASTKRTWEALAHEAIYDAGEWKRQCRELQVLNAELLAALKRMVETYREGCAPDREPTMVKQALAAIAKAEGR